MPRLLDEDDELYGYAIYNVHEGEFLTPLGRNSTATFREQEDMLRFLAEQLRTHQNLDEPSYSHLRIVHVRLDTSLDETAVRFLKQLEGNGYFKDEASEDYREDVMDLALDTRYGDSEG